MTEQKQHPLAVAFDWGGVFTVGTFDGSAVRALSRLAEKSEAAVAGHYFPLMAELEQGALSLAAFHRRLSDGLKVDLPWESFRDTFLGAVRERPEMVRLINRIPPHYRVAMLSNNVPVLCDTIRDDQNLARIEHFVFSNEIGVRKPDAKAFEHLSEALQIPPSRTVFIDDNEANVAVSEELGFIAIHFTTMQDFLGHWRRLLPDVAVAGGH